MIRRILTTVCAIALALSLCVSASASAIVSGSTDTGWDFVIIIDRSGTMTRTDPQGLALIATNMFIDRCEANNTSVAVIGYGFDITMIRDFTDLSDPAAVADLKAAVESCDIIPSDDTQTDKALALAGRMIADRRALYPDHSFRILVISDGKIDVGDSMGAIQTYGHRLTDDERVPYVEASRSQARQVVTSFEQDGVEVNCLGIYPGNDDSKLGTDMKDWADTTNGLYETTHSIDEVNDLVRRLYNAMTDAENIDPIFVGNDGKFYLQSGVLEANVEIEPGTSASNIELYRLDDNGENQIAQVPLPASAIRESLPYYTLIKLDKPEEGYYQLVFKDQTDHNLTVRLTINTLFNMRLSAPIGVRNGETTSDIYLTITRQGFPYYDPNGDMPRLIATDPNGNQQAGVMMTWDAANNRYQASFTPTMMGTYKLVAVFDALSMISRSNEVTLTASEAKISAASDVGDIAFTGHALRRYDADGTPWDGYAPYVVDLSGCFSDVDGIGIRGYEARFMSPGDEAYARLEVNNYDRTLTITPLRATSGAIPFELYANGMDDSISDPAAGSVTIEDMQAPVVVNNDVAQQFYTAELRALLPQKDGDVVIDNLNLCFTEPNYQADGEAFTVEAFVPEPENLPFGATPPDKLVEVIQDGAQLRLIGLKEGETDVVVRARSYDQSVAEFTMRVRVTDLKMYILTVAGIALAGLIALVIIILIIRQALKPAYKGFIDVRLHDGPEGQGSYSLRHFGKKKVKMSDVCRKCSVSMNGMAGKLDKIEMRPHRGSGVDIRGKVSGLSEGWHTISDGETMDISLDDNGNVLSLTYIYEKYEDQY